MSEPPPKVLNRVSERVLYNVGDADKYVPRQFRHLLAVCCAEQDC